MALFSKNSKSSNRGSKSKASTKAKTTAKSKVVTGGVKTRSKKKLAFLSLVGVLVLATLGYGGNLLWQKHNYAQLAKEVDANAASIEYKYGRHFQIRDNTKYKRLLVDAYACKWSSNTISVFSIRRGLITAAVYNIQVGGYTPSTMAQVAGSDYIQNWWYNMNITRFSTVNFGHNYMGYASARIKGFAQDNSDRYGSDPIGYNSSLRANISGPTKDLPSCHY